MIGCYPRSWESLWAAFHRTTSDTVDAKIVDFEAFADCAQLGPQARADLEVMRGRSAIKLRRSALFDALTAHGAEPCRRAAS